jgi:hypothetical protein
MVSKGRSVILINLYCVVAAVTVGVVVYYTRSVHRNCSYDQTYRVIKNNCLGFNLALQMQPHVISFYGVTSRIRFMFLLFSQVSQN